MSETIKGPTPEQIAEAAAQQSVSAAICQIAEHRRLIVHTMHEKRDRSALAELFSGLTS